MKFYTVHEPPHPPADRVDRAERIVLVRDGFDWSMLLFAPFVLLGRRLWFGLAIYVAALVGLTLLFAALDAGEEWLSLALAGLHAAFAFESGELERRRLARRGWTLLGLVNGRTRDECERRFFDQWLPRQPLLRAARPDDDFANGHGDVAAGRVETPATRATSTGARFGGFLGKAVRNGWRLGTPVRGA